MRHIWGHAAQPGPGYWDYRCVACGAPCDHHMFWWQRWFYRRKNGVKS